MDIMSVIKAKSTKSKIISMAVFISSVLMMFGVLLCFISLPFFLLKMGYVDEKLFGLYLLVALFLYLAALKVNCAMNSMKLNTEITALRSVLREIVKQKQSTDKEKGSLIVQ